MPSPFPVYRYYRIIVSMQRRLCNVRYEYISSLIRPYSQSISPFLLPVFFDYFLATKYALEYQATCRLLLVVVSLCHDTNTNLKQGLYLVIMHTIDTPPAMAAVIHTHALPTS